MKYLIDFSYSGADFNGYQKQPDKRTVQFEIEKVLTNINADKEVKITAAGRTDAKVNALHQMAHFVLNKEISPYKLKGALNSYLPDDIYINDVKCVNENFHARYMVKEKTYQYKINTGNYNPLLRTHVYQYCRTLNIKKMKEALSNFKGTHDFTTFTSSEDKRENKVRTIKNVSLSFSKDIITITFKAKGFLKYQVRNMVGTLIKVGEEKVDPSMIPVLLEKKDRKSAYTCAPAEGLTLINIKY